MNIHTYYTIHVSLIKLAVYIFQNFHMYRISLSNVLSSSLQKFSLHVNEASRCSVYFTAVAWQQQARSEAKVMSEYERLCLPPCRLALRDQRSTSNQVSRSFFTIEDRSSFSPCFILSSLLRHNFFLSVSPDESPSPRLCFAHSECSIFVLQILSRNENCHQKHPVLHVI